MTATKENFLKWIQQVLKKDQKVILNGLKVKTDYCITFFIL